MHHEGCGDDNERKRFLNNPPVFLQKNDLENDKLILDDVLEKLELRRKPNVENATFQQGEDMRLLFVGASTQKKLLGMVENRVRRHKGQ